MSAKASDPIVKISGLSKVYDTGFEALKSVNLDIKRGEVLALLGPNGAGKTSLISTICGVTRASTGTVTVDGLDHQKNYRAVRKMIGLVPQELSLEPFETVINTVTLSRGLFGMPRKDGTVERLLKRLSLWDKRDSRTNALSGGMKRRVLIAKALAHDPKVLFLDEPTAGVDVQLRKDMWNIVDELRQDGVTTILTTHYIEEAEAIADRVAVINKGSILLVEPKDQLMTRFGRKELRVRLVEKIGAVPEALAEFDLTLDEDGRTLTYVYDNAAERTGITRLLSALPAAGLTLDDVTTRESSLEEIFVSLVKQEEVAT